MSENQKKIWITGASSGIGKALAEKFASEGWKVAASARRKKILDEMSGHENIFSAANSGDLMKGIGNSFLSVKGVLINPGETKEILTLCFLKSKYKLSVRLVKAALDGP